MGVHAIIDSDDYEKVYHEIFSPWLKLHVKT